MNINIKCRVQCKRGNRRLHFARAVYSCHPLLADRRCGLSSTGVGMFTLSNRFTKIFGIGKLELLGDDCVITVSAVLIEHRVLTKDVVI